MNKKFFKKADRFLFRFYPAEENIRNYFLLALVLFLFSFLVGVLFVHFYPSLAKDAMFEMQKSFSFLLELDPIHLGVFIFFNNSVKILLFIILGILFAIPTLIFLLINGWVLGYVVAFNYPELGLEGLFFSLFFHGIFEFTALLIGGAMGIGLGLFSYRSFRNKNSSLKEELKENVKSSINVFLWIIIPLLLIAAIIETLLIMQNTPY